ncbi:MAG: MarR family transcriptional regulator [Candidatus Brockarchaeota archaeon]|nr:MarR family transcriptional regulator [Candidatus Brockarchaeota archaeon]MBO3808304.1 MarR family transcriptional regulator [Candidatus Brockarchaeota archaeon]
MAPLFGKGKKEKEIEERLSELKEKSEIFERRLDETIEKVEKVEKGVRLLTEAVYKIITYLKELELPKEEVKQITADRSLETVRKKEPPKEYLTETEKKLIDEIKKKGMLTVSECYAHIGRSKEHVSRMLKRLVEKGILIRERRGKIFYYRLAEE